MHTKIRKWGNSLALRIPRSFAKETRLRSGSVVDLRMKDGRLVVDPQPAPRYSLDALLEGVTDENRHAEVDPGDATGREVW
ncbi:MAG: AbrB/MazE/SpoVT family DNA-binding domain-containing protein [Planctomycetota bacterium]